MSNIFEQPWILLAVAFVLLVVVYIIRTSYYEKSKWWHLLIPVFACVAAFGVDYLVKTDHEKVKEVLESVIDATMAKDVDAIAPLIAEDYRDRYHPTKQFIMMTCRHMISRHKFQSIVMTYDAITIKGEIADAEILVRLRIDPENMSMPAPEFNFAKLNLTLKKKPDASWVIKSTELVEINKTPVNWKRAH